VPSTAATLPAPDVYDIDGELNSKATVDALHARGKKVVCYMDAGVYETYRSDASKFPAGIWGNADAGWAGSYWLDIRRVNDLAPIIRPGSRCARTRASMPSSRMRSPVDGAREPCSGAW
jgi:hypothetical protein